MHFIDLPSSVSVPLHRNMRSGRGFIFHMSGRTICYLVGWCSVIKVESNLKQSSTRLESPYNEVSQHFPHDKFKLGNCDLSAPGIMTLVPWGYELSDLML